MSGYYKMKNIPCYLWSAWWLQNTLCLGRHFVFYKIGSGYHCIESYDE